MEVLGVPSVLVQSVSVTVAGDESGKSQTPGGGSTQSRDLARDKYRLFLRVDDY